MSLVHFFDALILAQCVNIGFDSFVLCQGMNNNTIAEFDVTFTGSHVDILDHFHGLLLGSLDLTWLGRVFSKNLKEIVDDQTRRSMVGALTCASRMGKIRGMALPSHA